MYNSHPQYPSTLPTVQYTSNQPNPYTIGDNHNNNMSATTNGDIKDNKSKNAIVGGGNRYVRGVILAGVPVGMFILTLIFTLTNVPTQVIGAAIPLLLIGLTLFIYAAVVFIRLARLLFSESKWKKRDLQRQQPQKSSSLINLSTQTTKGVTSDNIGNNNDNTENDKSKQILNIFTLVEILLTSYYGMVLLHYSVYLFDNEQFKNLVFDLDASLVSSTSGHIKILWIFIFYVPVFAFGVGLTQYAPIKVAAEFLSYVALFWLQTLLIVIVTSIISVILDRRARAREGISLASASTLVANKFNS